ncbi:hypothetical protein [Pediococcus pentosaceus]|uniref:hypothetical protein n=1 Tax=Pediococcus pentosaceus TaxID=1255 RepID=UPI000C088FA5|nr:hypothetical protein [Pediococcus pentosaceus]QYY85490.1 hypothetical protein GRI00_02520 [Pediococcus pentosaceus]
MFKFDNQEIDETNLLTSIKNAYNDQLNYMGVTDGDLTRFSWSQNKCIHITFIKIHTETKIGHARRYLFFAQESKQNKIEYYDLYNKTASFDFDQLRIGIEQLIYIHNHNLLNILPDKIIKNSIQLIVLTENSTEAQLIKGLKQFGKDLAKNEYTSTKSSLEYRGKIENFPTLNKQIFVDKYHFDDMLHKINDNQFTDEFNQCLFAYENQKWFLCAAGLGSCLEHLMLLTLQNYGKEKQLGYNPTASNYLKAFTKEPISLESRQLTYIDTLFRIRNSVDHHNFGYTQKMICDQLMEGITNVFNEYYVASLSAK